VELSQARYTQGVSSLLPVLDMQEELLQEGYLLYGYERDYLLSVLKLIKALGGGYRS
jgi:outer membrane protein TolC